MLSVIRPRFVEPQTLLGANAVYVERTVIWPGSVALVRPLVCTPTPCLVAALAYRNR